MRSLAELRDVDDPAWPRLEGAIHEAAHPVEVLTFDTGTAESTLVSLQVTARSALGALALHTGGVLVDHGWLRILGSGAQPFNLLSINSDHAPSGYVVVAFDVLGGRYAINGGGLPASLGEVCYFAPDELAWVPMGFGFEAFFNWSMSERLSEFNEPLRWSGWEEEIAGLSPMDGINLYPFPFTVEGQDLSKVSRRPAAMPELFALWEKFANDLPKAPGQ